MHLIARRLSVLSLFTAFGVVGATGAGRAGGDGLEAARPQPTQSAAAAEHQVVRYPADGAQIEADLDRPRIGQQLPAIVLVHDDQGVNAQIRALAALFVRAGYVVLTPNLASRGAAPLAPASGTQGAGTLNRMGLPLVQTINDLLAGVRYLQQDAGVEATKISAVGLGWGAYRVWKMAERPGTLYRGVVFYGVTPTEDDVSTITTPMLGHYAQYDFILTASVLKTKKQLGPRFTYYIYPTSRGFLGGGSANSALDVAALTGEVDLAALEADRKAGRTGSGSPARGDREPARLALERTLAFLKQ